MFDPEENTMGQNPVRYATKTARSAAESLGGAAATAAGSFGSAATTAATAVAAAAFAASLVLSPVPDAASRLEGVHSDLQRAVELNQITAEQAEKFEAKLAGRILGED